MDATVPALGLSVTLVLKFPPELNDNSKPAGAVTTKSAVRSVALTVKLCSAETAPAQAVNVLRLPPLEIVGLPELVIKATFAVLPAPDAVTELIENPLIDVFTVVLLVNVTV